MVNATEIGDAAKNATTSVINALREAAAADTSVPRLFFPNGIDEIEVRFTVTEPDGTTIEFEMSFEGTKETNSFDDTGWYGEDDFELDDLADEDDAEEPEISKN